MPINIKKKKPTAVNNYYPPPHPISTILKTRHYYYPSLNDQIFMKHIYVFHPFSPLSIVEKNTIKLHRLHTAKVVKGSRAIDIINIYIFFSQHNNTHMVITVCVD